MTLSINPSFRDLIPPLSADEYSRLEESIIADGCRDALTVWNGFIVDGHNRYAICRKNGIEFKVTEMQFGSDDEAKIWIIGNQLGRRNLSDAVRGDLAWQQSGMIAAMAKARSRSGANQYSPGAERHQGSETGRTADILAKRVDIPARTLSKIKQVRDSGNEEVRQKMLSGEVSITKASEMVATPKPVIKTEKPMTFGGLIGCGEQTRREVSNSNVKNFDVNAMYERQLSQKEKPSEEGGIERDPDNHILSEYIETIKHIRLELNKFLYVSWAATSGTDEAEKQTAEVVDNLTTIMRSMKEQNHD